MSVFGFLAMEMIRGNSKNNVESCMLMMAISPNPFIKKLKILIIHRNEKVRGTKEM